VFVCYGAIDTFRHRRTGGSTSAGLTAIDSDGGFDGDDCGGVDFSGFDGGDCAGGGE
jgi:hypothetical protein